MRIDTIIKKEKNNSNIVYSLICILFLIVIYFMNLQDYHSIVIVNDEFGYWGLGAYFSGKTWKDLFATTPYYSYGYSLLMIPFYLLNFRPGSMYQVMLIINCILIIISFIFSLKCYDELCVNDNAKLKYAICLVISCYTNNIIQAKIAWTETLLYTLVWILLYILIKNVKRLSYLNALAGAFAAMYMYIVHQRSIGIVLVYYVAIFIICLIKKNDIKKYVTLVIVTGVLFYIHLYIKDNIIGDLFTNDTLVTMNNMGGQTSKIKNILTTVNGAGKFIQSFIGKFYYASVSTFYIFPIMLLRLIKMLRIEVLNCIENKKCYIKDKTYIYVYIMLSFLALLTITSISMYINIGRLDLLIYGRYMEMAIGPILLIGMIELTHSSNIEKYIVVSAVTLFLFSFVVDYGLIEADTNVFNSVCATTLTYFFNTKTSVSALAHSITIMTIIPLLLFYILSKKRKKTVCVLAFGVAWLFLANFSGTKSQQEYIKDNVMPIVEKIELLREDISNIYFIQKDGTDDDSQTYVKYVQYFQPDKAIEIVNTTETDEISWKKESCILCGVGVPISEEISDMFNTELCTMKLRLLIEK